MKYFTAVSPKYLPDANQLVISAKNFNIDVEVLVLPEETGELAREQFINKKPRLILKQLEHYKEPVCWLDSDTRIEQPLELFKQLEQTNYDFSVLCWEDLIVEENGEELNLLHCRDFRIPQPVDFFVPNPPLMCSGGVYVFFNTPGSKYLLNKWVSVAEKKIEKGIGDDLRLDETYNSLSSIEKNFIKLFPLPCTYNRMVSHFPKIKPVINHLMKTGK